MAKKIPDDFDYKKISLDELEVKVRDDWNVNIENWAKFRHTITASVNSNTLKSIQPISDDVKSSYIELSKSHYEVVTMLGAVRWSLENVKLSMNSAPLLFKKSFKEFYIHCGAVLDNLARLIYIVNIPSAPTSLGRYGLNRHSIGYGGLKSVLNNQPQNLKGYNRIIKNRKINEIKVIRNNFTHSWPPVIYIDKNSKEYLWPIAMRKREQYYLWPHDPNEQNRIRQEYRKKIPIKKMIEDDWNEIEHFQNYVFKKLHKDIAKFEKNHNLKIGE